MSAGIDLSDISVVVSVKVDSEDRLTNLERMVYYYLHHGRDAEIIVVEQGDTTGQVSMERLQGVSHVFVDDPGCHWKTRNMNLGARLSARRALLMSDCDTIPHPEALAEGVEALAKGDDLVHLYNGVVVNVSKRLAATIETWSDFLDRARTIRPEEVDPDQSLDDPDQWPMYGDSRYLAVGGCFLVRRWSFLRAGGWNENFISYGFEDMELDTRLRKLGLACRRADSHSLYHFEHARGWDSRYSTFRDLNRQEWERVAEMEPSELQRYADRAFRGITFDHDHDYVRQSGPAKEVWRKVSPNRKDLAELVVVVIADAKLVGYMDSCLERFADYLETHFFGYDLRLNELSGTSFKHARVQMNAEYRVWSRADEASDLAAVLADAGRNYFYTLRLGRDADNQLKRAISVFERLRDGTPADALFARC